MIKLYNFDELRPEEILNRDIRAEKNVEDVVDGIIAEVRARGDEALKEYALKFDGAKIDDLQVTQAEIDEAFANMDPYFLETLREAAANIERFHRQQVHKNFVMNDKCAAGTGRFLDVMARVLEVKVQDLGMLGAQSTKQVEISSTCTVFAESEVISQLSMGTDKRDIINGIHRSVASRVAGLAHRVGIRDQVVMTGGVAQNSGVVKALEEALGHEVHISPLTQYNGALGAALFAYQKYQKAQRA